MSRLTEALGGPVLAWELRQAARRKLGWVLRWGYCGWLFLQACVFFNAIRSAGQELPSDPHARLELFRTINAQRVLFLENYLGTLLQIQLILILVTIPALSAGSLGLEKERGTLFALFGTQLSSRQILLGKLLGRLILIVPVVLTTLPALIFLAAFTGQGLAVVLALLQEVILTFALGAAGLLFAIWIRRASDAVIAAYVVLGLAYLLVRGLTASLTEAMWFDPLENLRKLLFADTRVEALPYLLVWAFLGVLCLRLGWGRLRKVCVEQHDRKPSRRMWRFRPRVSNNPIRWRECYLIGLTPMPMLRIVPRWLALLGAFAFSAGIAGFIANSLAPRFLPAVLNFRLVPAYQDLLARKSEIIDSIRFLGLIFILFACLLIGVRCGTSVAEEKRRNTWDDLLLTANSFREITNGKMWGVLQATFPYVVAYAIPAFLLAWAAGPVGLLTAALWILLPSVVVFAAALLGIDMLRVPPEMDETRPGRAFSFESEQACASDRAEKRRDWKRRIYS